MIALLFLLVVLLGWLIRNTYSAEQALALAEGATASEESDDGHESSSCHQSISSGRIVLGTFSH